ncbi:MAG: hypothetical protein AAFU77_00720 [Myxococcota bacterium]
MISDEELSAFLDGDLSEEDRARVSDALSVDPDAEGRMEGIRGMRDALGVGVFEGPSRDLWAEIEAQVRRPRWWQLPRVQFAFALGAVAAAALVLVAVTGPAPNAGVGTLAQNDDALVERAQGEIDAAKKAYLSAIQILEQRAERYVDALPDEQRMKLRTSLFEVEQAIARVETVLHDHPNDSSAHTTLVALYDQKMRVLRSTVELSEPFYEVK